MDSPGSTLPPPSPPAPPPSRTLFIGLAVAGLLAACIMAVLWLGARSDANDATAERDTLITERDLANDANVELSTELQVAQGKLDTAQQELSDAGGTTDAASVDALEDQVADLEAEVERLTNENEALAADLEAAQSTIDPTAEPDESAEPDVAAATTPPPTTIPPTTTTIEPVEAPDLLSATQVGSRIAGLYRNDVLGPGQELCIGQAVIDDLGADVVSALFAGEDPGADEGLMTSIRAAASACLVDPSAVFG